MEEPEVKAPPKIPETQVESMRAVQRVAEIFERMRITDYINYLNSPGRVIFFNFLAGLSRGLGFTLGATVLVAFSVYLLSHMVDIPLIGRYVAKIVTIVQQELGTRNGIH